MINKICANIDKNHIYNCTSKTIGRQGENICTQLEITLEECLCDSWVYLHFEKADGTTKVTPKLEIVDNVVIYDIGNDLLDIAGDLKVFVELHKESGLVWKSSTKTYTVLDSFNGADQIENKEDFITEAQKVLNDVENGLTPTIGENGNWYVGDKDTGKPSQGKQGEPGIQGKPGSVKFIIVAELPIENIEEDAIYMKPSESPETQNTYEEYIYVDGVWESLGSAKVDVDLKDYVKNTDYATLSTHGVVKFENTFGISVDNNGRPFINRASNDEIDAKKVTYKPIVPANLDYAVKSGLINNTLEWTDEEKTNACNLIDAVERVEYSQENTLPSGSDGGYYGRAYVRDKTNMENSIPISSQNRNYTMPIRDHNGNFYVGNPTIAYHCANKQYVDDLVGNIESLLSEV